MKHIINGKVYDTEKAKYLGVDSYSNPSDFHYWCEELYQKRTGEFFLYGKGGPMSRYAERIEQNGWSGGEQIIPLTYDKAREWAEEHLRVEYYEEIFGASPRMPRTSTSISRSAQIPPQSSAASPASRGSRSRPRLRGSSKMHKGAGLRARFLVGTLQEPCGSFVGINNRFTRFYALPRRSKPDSRRQKEARNRRIYRRSRAFGGEGGI